MGGVGEEAATALHLSVLHSNVCVAPCCNFNDSPLICEQTEMVGVLLQADAPLTALDGRGRTALHVAAAAGCDASVVLLLERGSSPNSVSSSGMCVQPCFW